ncbi:MAG: hypothetical protein HZA51_08440 [Planctomycetes bacterium]|nr:hypothetical protein [Planctomycetota bacterium]
MMNAVVQTSINPLRALHRKEWAESKPALLVGLIIFVGLPTLWTLLLWSLDTHAGVLPGIASMLWLVAGGMFAAVLGAQVICRDFGAPTERFLLSRPIAPSSVMRVKALTGFLMLIGLAVLIGAMELLWSSLVKGTHRDEQIPVAVYVLGTGLAMCAYWIAVGAACATRRSLTSAFAAAFVLALMVTVPAIVRIPGVNDFTDLAFSDQHNYRTGLVAAALVAVFGGVAALAMRWAVVTDQRLDVGPRTMAWIVGLTLMVLFVTAMREVGATEPLLTTWWGEVSLHSYVRFAAGRHHVAMRIDKSESNESSLELFDLDPNGQIIVHRRKAFTEPRMISDRATAIDAKGNLVFVGMLYDTDSAHHPKKLPQMLLRTFDWESMSLTSEIELPCSADLRQWHPADIYCKDSLVYVLLVGWETETNSNTITTFKCDVAEYEITANSASLKSTQTRLFSSVPGSAEPRWATVGGFASGQMLRISTIWSGEFRLAPLESPDVLESLDARSDRFGLHIIPGTTGTSSTQRWPTDSQGAIGHAHASPWGAIFRSARPNVLPIGNGRLLEMHSFSLIEYDGSDPTHPTRIAHLTSPPIDEVTVMGDLLVISHGRGFSIARLPSVKSP